MAKKYTDDINYERGKCRHVEISRTNYDDLHDAPVYVPSAPDDHADREADLRKAIK